MQYAITYSRNFQYMELVDEVILYWSTKDDIVDYVTTTFPQETRVTINFHTKTIEELESALPILGKLKKEHDNIVVKLDITVHKDKLEDLKQLNIDYYFNQYCASWDMLFGQVQLGVSDVIIAEELAFDLKNVKRYCKPFNIKIRVYPNVAQAGGRGTSLEIPDMMKFFIRPEDTEIYEPYVDIFEIWGDTKQQNTIFKIYYSQQWLGDLNNIISGFTDSVQNNALSSYFGISRIKCGKKCMQGRCKICLEMKRLANSMDKQGYEVPTERRKIENQLRINKEALSDEGRETDEYSSEASESEEI